MAEAPDPREKAIVDKVVLEQVFQAVPSPVQTWLMRNGPSSLTHVAMYLENYFLAERAIQAKAPVSDKAGGRGQGKGETEEHPREAKLSKPAAFLGNHRPTFSGQPLRGGNPPPGAADTCLRGREVSPTCQDLGARVLDWGPIFCVGKWDI